MTNKWGLVVLAGMLEVLAPVDLSYAAGSLLVTPQEAAMPPAKYAREKKIMRSVFPGPRITVKSPVSLKDVSPPVKIDVAFEPTSIPIDRDSLKILYVKFVDIDITDRVRPYITPAGIRIPDADLPSGKHTIEIDLRDLDGNVTSSEMTFTVK
ncbi:MAG: hypothetical protein HQL37_10960 [Alphaproteobacteria bacterium]|nr:hypothetical protein [Alphaproteobacteria bacterium]